MIKISIFGNPDLDEDSLPLKIIPKLQERFPQLQFIAEDPNELDVPPEGKWIIIDTIKGIDEVRTLALKEISKENGRISMHGFDLGMYLLWTKKLSGKTEIIIIGIPEEIDEEEALEQVSAILSELI